MDERPRKRPRSEQSLGHCPLLTEDILATVFTFLHPGNLFYTKRVCKIWHKASYNDRVLTCAVCYYFDINEANIKITNIDSIRTLFNTFCFREIAITRFYEEYQSIRLDNENNLHLKLEALSNLYAASKLEWQRAFMQKYWTDTVAANTDLIAENFGENPKEFISYFSNMTQHIGFIGAKYYWGSYWVGRTFQEESIEMIIIGKNGNLAKVIYNFSAMLKYDSLVGHMERYGFSANLYSLATYTAPHSLQLATFCCWDEDDQPENSYSFSNLNQHRDSNSMRFYVAPNEESFNTMLQWLGYNEQINMQQLYMYLRAISANPDTIYPPANFSPIDFHGILQQRLSGDKISEKEALASCGPSLLFEMKRLELYAEIDKILTNTNSPLLTVEEGVKLNLKQEMFTLIDRISFSVWEESIGLPFIKRFGVAFARFIMLTLRSEESQNPMFMQLVFATTTEKDLIKCTWEISIRETDIAITKTEESEVLDKYWGIPEVIDQLKINVSKSNIEKLNSYICGKLVNQDILADMIIIISGLHKYVSRIELNKDKGTRLDCIV